MADKGKPTLPGLPGEIVNNIARELIDIDVASLHAVNKALFEKTKYAYAKRYLTHIHVFLHPTSFEKLHRLANDPFYATLIEHVTISTYVLRDGTDRRKGSSVKPFEEEKSFILRSAAQAITDVLKKTTALKSLTISDFSNGSTYWPSDDREPPAWGIKDLNRLVTFKRGKAVVIGYQYPDDLKVWSTRIKAFEAALIGMANAKLPVHVELRMVLEGNAPRPLSPTAQPLFLHVLSSAAHFSTNVDTYVDSRENVDWLSKINPMTLNLDYDLGAWEAPDAPGLHLRHYDRLANVRITNAKTDSLELNDFLNAHSKTLQRVELKNVCLLWTDLGDYPWRVIFLTLAKMAALQHLWLNTLSAVPLEYESRDTDCRAFQEVAWKTKLHVSHGLNILCDYYNRQGARSTFVDMDYVDEKITELYGVTI
ncbi:uncharacterized protein N0V89_002700 [Didymosphaeria variabile]|uniref:Uncharacterized protein n=1 Tax=Didymosphaeria variabile TaxID=1932322 RepID=A0A9W8XT07_9PLEO|nr:uncharacterized protein N0V89_002700 [Didymosphaeria variabile]KAJ4358121.1 hypothetical protein N0V89_002700 [Didymosphaeria variabile]